MPPMTSPGDGAEKRYWRSLDDFADTPEFRRWAQAEFPALADAPEGGASRREFLRLLGASVALAGLSGCRWPREEILPFAERPEDRVPGVPERYATAFEYGGHAQGLLVTSFDGRPIKVEGHPEHPASRGASSALAQASILSLYDPDRSRHPIAGSGSQGRRVAWSEVDRSLAARFAALGERGGAGLAVLIEASSSPTRARLQERLRASFPQATWHEFEPISRDNEREGTRTAFGAPMRPQYDLARAEVVVCLDADLLGSHPAALTHARDFATSRRRIDSGTTSRWYALESAFSITGAVADERRPVPSRAIAGILAAIAHGLAAANVSLPAAVVEAVAPWASGEPATSSLVAPIVADLLAHRGAGLIAVGSRQPPAVHALAACLNEALDAPGNTVTFAPSPDPDRPPHAAAIAALAADLEAGKVDTLLVLGANPVFTAPADLDFATRLKKAKTRIHVGLYRDETARRCDWHLPETHYLEAWGDARSWDGTVSVVQPLIRPLHEGRSALELLAGLLGEERDGRALVKATIAKLAGATDDAARQEATWRQAVHDGHLAGSAPAPVRPTVDPAAVARAVTMLPAQTDAASADIELVFTADASVFDGRFASNAWLQENPDPLTKLTWDNALLVGPATAEQLGLSHGALVEVEAARRSIEAPVFVAPGQADGSLAIALGYGRKAAGSVGSDVGVDAYRLRTVGTLGWVSGVGVKSTGRKYTLATTQDHFAIDDLGRQEAERRRPELVREATLAEFRSDPDFVRHRGHDIKLFSLWKELEFEGRSWGMTIDLNTCIGCSACTLACQAENNIPVVGKEQIDRGREMAWLRVDRYYGGDPDDPSIAFQPVACQHCEMAPCEEVCPAAATVHDAEGLNTMVYNRCVGTRYCANNCPYKVRRFNFFNYHKDLTELESLGLHPDVTVRERGVMEKCTFCVQRINQVKIRAKNEKRPIADGDILPACAQACPTQAIVFGDLSDESSRVRQLQQDRRAYALLAEINVRPRTKYLGRVRNPLPTAGAEKRTGEHG